jgi:hypothetical protein
MKDPDPDPGGPKHSDPLTLYSSEDKRVPESLESPILESEVFLRIVKFFKHDKHNSLFYNLTATT